MNLKKVFNWLAQPDTKGSTLGSALRSTLFKGTKKEAYGNFFGFSRGGRIAERTVTLTACFAAAAVLPFGFALSTVPYLTVSLSKLALASAALVVNGKAAGIVTGKVTDFAVRKINNAL